MKNNLKNLKELARQLGSMGGKKSAQSRFKGKSKKEISEMMRLVRISKKIGKNALDGVRRIKP